jgi:hypothetical protein
VTNPELATVLRNMKVPERMAASQGLRAFLLAATEGGKDMANTDETQKQLNWLMLLSHLEVINALGALEERIAEAQYNQLQDGISKYRKRRRWF